MSTPQEIIFLDIETNGLDAGPTGAVLEIGAIVTNGELEEIDSFHAVLPYRRTGEEDPYVLQMHEANGLWMECETLASNEDQPEDSWYLGNCQVGPDDWGGPADLRSFFARYPGAWLAGRAVKSFDQAFLEAKYPGCTAGLSHRSIDIRTLIRLEDFVPGLWDGLGVTPGDAHRAMDDARGDLETLRGMVGRLRMLRGRWVP